ncbi:MAG: hypothetical protein ACREXN_14730, partial [Polaromonas sp.]
PLPRRHGRSWHLNAESTIQPGRHRPLDAAQGQPDWMAGAEKAACPLPVSTSINHQKEAHAALDSL